MKTTAYQRFLGTVPDQEWINISIGQRVGVCYPCEFGVKNNTIARHLRKEGFVTAKCGDALYFARERYQLGG